jgi:aspartyl-tRNA(Asn)/glutamyl-tRNA(Gln) amidotransferase subunit C
MLTQEEVRAIGALARIELTDEEVTRFQKDLSGVLDLFTELETLDTDAVAPIGHITGRTGEARVDIPNEASVETRKQITENFPESEEGYLRVSPVL